MNNRNQTFYYHIGKQNTKDIQVKITLRKVISNNSSNEVKFIPDEEIVKVISWQECISGPSCNKKQSKNRFNINPESRIVELDNKEHSNVSDENINLTNDFQEDVIIHTYTDKNFFCSSPTNKKEGRCDSSCDTHLKDVISSLPVHNLHTRSRLKWRSDCSTSIHDRMSREDTFEMMYIVASARNNYTHDDEKDGCDYFHEEVLCQMKLYNSGMFEVTPGFSIIEPEDTDDNIFVSLEHLKKMVTKGPNLTTFTFTTPSGLIYQYSLEWIGYLEDPNQVESLALRELDEHYRLLSQRRKMLLWNIEERGLTVNDLADAADETLVQINIESIEGFRNKWKNDYLSVEYDITIPNESDSIRGSTMLMDFPKSSSGYYYKTIGLTGATIFCLVLLVLLFDANVYVIVITLLLTKIASTTIFGDSCHSCNLDSKCYFSHNVSFCAPNYQKIDNMLENSQKKEIKLFLQVCATNKSTKIKRIVGYGSALLPTECGEYDLSIQTCRLVSSPFMSNWGKVLFSINDYFFGCTFGDIKTMRDLFFTPLLKDNSNQNIFTSLFTTKQVTSEPSGMVTVNSRVMSKVADNNSNTYGNPRVRHLLDEVLSKVRRQKRATNQSHFSQNRIPSELLSDKTNELISRVKARREARQQN